MSARSSLVSPREVRRPAAGAAPARRARIRVPRGLRRFGRRLVPSHVPAPRESSDMCPEERLSIDGRGWCCVAAAAAAPGGGTRTPTMPPRDLAAAAVACPPGRCHRADFRVPRTRAEANALVVRPSPAGRRRGGRRVVRVRRRHPGPDAGGAGSRPADRLGGSPGRAGAARRRRSQDASLTMEDVDEPRLTVSGAARRLGSPASCARGPPLRRRPAEHTRGRHARTPRWTWPASRSCNTRGQGGVARPRRRASPSGGPGRPRARRVTATNRGDRASSGAQQASRPGARSRCRDRRDRVAGSGGSARTRAPRTTGRAHCRRPHRAERGRPADAGVGTAARGLAAPPWRWIRRQPADRRGVHRRRRLGRDVGRGRPSRPGRCGRADPPDGTRVEVAACWRGHGCRVPRPAYAGPPPSPMRPVLVAGMPDDEYGVPLAALGAVLAERRIASRSLGRRCPHPRSSPRSAASRRLGRSLGAGFSRRPTSTSSPRSRSPAPRFRTYVRRSRLGGRRTPARSRSGSAR